MRRYVFLLCAACLWALAGCAGVHDPREGAIELVPGRSYQVMMAGQRYFTFTLEAPAKVVLESHTFPADVGFVSPAGQLLDSEGRVVARDWTSGADSNFRIEESLAAGTWYLRVSNPHACRSAFDCLHRDYRYEVLLTIAED
ncbi:PPC domain-containing protein [Halomonas sp. M4R5S39]|uniref:PPC domain-containing protein n=1 Tax=Halomonas kalidii TaxID=3043293 RepID=UPI0024A90833|nr:PPC domain-containing protein [Halomonas kalidii]MDI5985126.1 PPC domain-containing protein [Halomonas kalidii]